MFALKLNYYVLGVLTYLMVTPLLRIGHCKK